jgi:cell division protein FtsA
LTDEVSRALKSLGFAGQRGQPIVLTGGGAELPGLADYAQAALGRPVRTGKPPQITGLPEAHATPGFATLAGLILYAAADPVDIRAIGAARQQTFRYSPLGLANRVFRAVREYF